LGLIVALAAALIAIASILAGFVLGAIGSLIGVISAIGVIFYLGGRLSLILPAAAIGHYSFGLKSSWESTRTDHWRVMICYALFYTPLILAVGIIGLIVGKVMGAGSPALPTIVIASVVYNAAVMLTAACTVSCLSWMYGQLGEKPNWLG
jgi:membrane-anchored glycerophosphoryl diester phosphodiesterase (GDPDase)